MEMDFKQLAAAIKIISEEKNLPEELVTEVVEQALAAAYRRDYGDREQEVRVSMNLNTGEVTAFVTKDIVETLEDDRSQISLANAQVMRKNAKVGETVEIVQKVEDFGRVAAQTAKQVILQRLREAEREIVLSEFEDKIGTVVNGVISRVEGRVVRVELGKAQGLMPMSEQIQGASSESTESMTTKSPWLGEMCCSGMKLPESHFSRFWSCSTAWRWKNVPRPQSWPEMRTAKPSLRSEA